VTLARAQGGLEALSIDRESAKGALYLQGATVTAWQPKDQAPVLWVSAKSLYQVDKAIRGGIPICFPWFGPKADQPSAPQHGFARSRPWMLQSVADDPKDRSVTVTLVLAADRETRALWPHDFRARYAVRMGQKLEIALTVENTGESPFRFEEALHTYLAVADVRGARVEGLEDTRYFDKVDNGKEKRMGPREAITVGGETDRVYVGTSSATELIDPGMNRRISIQKDGSRTTVVWNPWIDKARAMKDFGDDEWKEMICVETANSGPDAIDLEPGGSHTIRALYAVNALA
jgi:D-hexose-6-phosphate mutarotase